MNILLQTLVSSLELHWKLSTLWEGIFNDTMRFCFTRATRASPSPPFPELPSPSPAAWPASPHPPSTSPSTSRQTCARRRAPWGTCSAWTLWKWKGWPSRKLSSGAQEVVWPNCPHRPFRPEDKNLVKTLQIPDKKHWYCTNSPHHLKSHSLWPLESHLVWDPGRLR